MTPDSIPRAERDETLLVIHRLPLIDMMEITAQSSQRLWVLEASWSSSTLGSLTSFLWRPHLVSMGMPWNHHEITMKSPWNHHEPPIFGCLKSREIPWNHHEITMKSSHCCWASPCHPGPILGRRTSPGLGHRRGGFFGVKWRMELRFGYGSIPINTIFRGMNIHFPAILMWTEGVQGFDTLPFGRWGPPITSLTMVYGNCNYVWLLVSNMNCIFHNIWDVILPIDSYFSEGFKPPTSSGKHTKIHGQLAFLMGKSTISMAMFNSKLLNY